uniref:Centrin-2 n=1 Tax=Lygus hesperus TaxID=30085 RepID=A0A0A9XIT7_LYGHE
MLKATYSLNQLDEEEPEPDFLKDIQKTLDDQKITAQDLLVQDKEFNESESKLNARWASDRREFTPPLPSGGVRITDTKCWVPKTINPMVIKLRKFQLKELKDAFDFLEDHKTGMVDVNDVATVVRACGFEPKHGEVSDILDKINPHYPGSLSLEEFNQVFEYKLDQKDPTQEIERAFKLMDLSKTGKVTKEDLRLISKLVDYEVNDEELQQMIDQASPSPDGNASMKGFVHLMTRKQYFDEPTVVVKSKKKPSTPEMKKYRKSYRSKSVLPVQLEDGRSKSQPLDASRSNFATIVQM